MFRFSAAFFFFVCALRANVCCLFLCLLSHCIAAADAAIVCTFYFHYLYACSNTCSICVCVYIEAAAALSFSLCLAKKCNLLRGNLNCYDIIIISSCRLAHIKLFLYLKRDKENGVEWLKIKVNDGALCYF